MEGRKIRLKKVEQNVLKPHKDAFAYKSVPVISN